MHDNVKISCRQREIGRLGDVVQPITSQTAKATGFKKAITTVFMRTGDIPMRRSAL